MAKHGNTIVTIILIALNVAVFVAVLIFPHLTMFYNSGVLSAEAIEHSRYWTLITSMFLHGSLIHLMCNMVSLYYLGTFSETVFGKLRFLAIYFVSGIAGGIAYCFVAALTNNLAGAVGASGAIFGLVGAYGYVLFREYKNRRIFAESPTRNDITSLLTLLGINIVFGLTTPGIANEAHIGGLTAGFVLSAAMYAQLARQR